MTWPFDGGRSFAFVVRASEVRRAGVDISSPPELLDFAYVGLLLFLCVEAGVLCLDVYRNGAKVCRASAGERGLLSGRIDACVSANVVSKASSDCIEFVTLRVSGRNTLAAVGPQSLSWAVSDLVEGDEIRIQVVSSTEFDPPMDRQVDVMSQKDASDVLERINSSFARSWWWRLTAFFRG